MKIACLPGLLIAFVLGSLYAPVAAAHVLKSQGAIGAVLHIEPADDPVAGEESSLYFEFEDKTNRFRTEDCDCRLVVEKAGQVIYNRPFEQPNGGSFTFPDADIYTVKAAGNPKAGNSFQPFELSYEIRVEREAGTPSSSQNNLARNAAIFAVVGTAVMAAAIIFRNRKRQG